VRLKSKKTIGLISLLVALIISITLFSGCVRGVVAVGWSGGAVANGNLYVGSKDGRLVAVNLADSSVLKADPITVQAQGGLFSCSSLGCGGGSSAVPIYGTPVVADELVYIAGYNGKIYAYRTDNLAQRWIYPREGYLQSFVGGIVVYENKLYVGCTSGKIYALDAETGDLLYQYQTDGKVWGTPAIDAENDTLLVGSYDKTLYALSLNDLSLKWSYTTEGSIISTPLVENGIVYFGSFDRNLYALKASDGTLVWKFMGENWFWAKPEILNGVLYAACLDHFVYALNPATGAEVHEAYDLKSPVSSAPAVVANLIVFASREGVVYKIDTTSGEITQITELDTNVDGPLAAYDGIVYIHPGKANLVRINPETGAILPAIPL